jgi:hypothetical protein
VIGLQARQSGNPKGRPFKMPITERYEVHEVVLIAHQDLKSLRGHVKRYGGSLPDATDM